MKWHKVFLLIGILFLLSFFREIVILLLNTAYYHVSFPYNPAYIKPPSFLFDIPRQWLLTGKLLFYITYSLIFYCVSYKLLLLFFLNNMNLYGGFYLMLHIIALILLLLAHLLHLSLLDKTFHEILYFTHSPLYPIIFLIYQKTFSIR